MSLKVISQSASYLPERVKHRLVVWTDESGRRPWRVTEMGPTMATLREYRTDGLEIPLAVRDAAQRSDTGAVWA